MTGKKLTQEQAEATEEALKNLEDQQRCLGDAIAAARARRAVEDELARKTFLESPERKDVSFAAMMRRCQTEPAAASTASPVPSFRAMMQEEQAEEEQADQSPEKRRPAPATLRKKKKARRKRNTVSAKKERGGRGRPGSRPGQAARGRKLSSSQNNLLRVFGSREETLGAATTQFKEKHVFNRAQNRWEVRRHATH